MLDLLRMAEWGFADHFGQGLRQLLHFDVVEKFPFESLPTEVSGYFPTLVRRKPLFNILLL